MTEKDMDTIRNTPSGWIATTSEGKFFIEQSIRGCRGCEYDPDNTGNGCELANPDGACFGGSRPDHVGVILIRL